MQELLGKTAKFPKKLTNLKGDFLLESYRRVGNRSVVMRSTLISLFSLVALTANSLAISGGPFDDNLTGNGGQGTFQAILEIPNGSGIARWTEASGGTGSGAQVSPLNSSQIFFRGIIYIGTTFAVIDSNRKRVTGMTNGSSTGFQDTSTTTTASANFFTFGVEESTDNVDGAGSGAGGIIRTCNTSWDGDVTDTAPFLEFEAEGSAFFFGDLDAQRTEVVDIENDAAVNQDILDAFTEIIDAFNGGGTNNPGVTIQGVDDILTLFNTTVGNRDSSTVITSGTGGQDNVFPDLGVEVPVKVFGHQISFQVNPPLGGTGTTGLEGTGRGTFLF